ncbi:ABC transporter permease [Chitinophaga filiformis]|uniref:ABC transporter permease n=1 Tax=Chitinophaga filiformis TaxID=104663 RepID=UPI001F2DB089|nr:ABC transporter permease [Chitinophaga filiformis]MCF6407595.1 ABC transporter permease [Chitinophaga filiformis]MCF6407700.1 ABC transporter permease [Chitinophaga filiformis]
MLKSYLKIALRNLWKNKIFTTINIAGLALGMACALLIIFHVKQELSYDEGYSKADRIFRVTLQGKGEGARHWAATSFPTGPALQEEFPEVVNIVRFHRPYPLQVFSYTAPNGVINKFEEKNGFFADPTVTDVFDLDFVAGDKATALQGPDNIVITEKMAQRYFGDTDPVGKVLRDDVNNAPLKVTGVIREHTYPSHLQFDYLLSMATIRHHQNDQSLANRTWNGFYTYVVLDKAASFEKVRSRLNDLTVKFFLPTGETREEILADREIGLQPITDIHLHSKLEKEMAPNSDITYVRIFSLAALFILLIAAVNFINLYTAQAFGRMKEIGMRKVVGATRQQVIIQILAESLITSLAASVLALILFKAAIPFYNVIASRSLYAGELFTFSNLGIIALLIIFIGLLAGSYPAWSVARFHPVTALKGKGTPGSSVNAIRKGLVIFQFVVSVFMIISTIVIYRQIRFFHDKDLGFDRTQLAAVTIYGPMWQRFGSLINDINQSPDIADFSIVSTLPGDRFSSQPFMPLSSDPKQEFDNSRIMWSDERLLPTLQIPLLEGRNFLNQMPAVKHKEYIINESAVKAYHLTSPIGERFVLDGDTGTVVGVVKNFNFASLHTPVDPLVIKYDPYRANYLLLKIRPGRIQPALAFMEKKIKTLTPTGTFTYTFIDDKLNRLYASENQMSTIFKAFAAFAIFISCMGLFGLSAYAAQLRIKEVSIRKVLGASSSYIALLLSRDFVKLVFIAILLSCPIAWWAMDKWLNNFAYRIPISGWMFVLAGVFALVVAVLTVSYQALKIALTNPVKYLKAD